MKKVFYILGSVVFFVVLVGIFGNISLDTTAYPVQCNDWFSKEPPYDSIPPETQNYDTCYTPVALKRQTFNVDVSGNKVTETSLDSSDVYKLNYCTVQDSKHWSCGDGFLKMPGGILASTKISRGGSNFSEYGLTNVIFVTKSQWESVTKKSFD